MQRVQEKRSAIRYMTLVVVMVAKLGFSALRSKTTRSECPGSRHASKISDFRFAIAPQTSRLQRAAISAVPIALRTTRCSRATEMAANTWTSAP